MSQTMLRQSSFTRTEGRPQRDGITPRFHMEAVVDPVRTAKEGHPCYKQEERVQFLLPGSPNQPVERVTDEHRNRWPEAYERFRRGEEMSADGTPLEMWPLLKKHQVHELKALNIYSIEQVADIPDSAVQRIQYGSRLKQLAQAYLDDAKATALTAAQSAEIDSLKASNAELNSKVAELSSLLNTMHGQLTALQNRPSEIATYVPAQHDPVAAAMAMVVEEPSPPALADLPEPRRRGRPPLHREAH